MIGGRIYAQDVVCRHKSGCETCPVESCPTCSMSGPHSIRAKNADNHHCDISTDDTERFSDAFERYILPTSGWLGLVVVVGWMFGIISEGVALAVLLFVSATASIFGHHALTMGWYDQSDDTGTKQEEYQ